MIRKIFTMLFANCCVGGQTVVQQPAHGLDGGHERRRAGRHVLSVRSEKWRSGEVEWWTGVDLVGGVSYLCLSAFFCGLSRRSPAAAGEGGFVCCSRPFAVILCSYWGLTR